MRRSDRKTDEKEAFRILQNGEYGILSTVDAAGQPYGIPLNYCVIDKNIYFHCGLAGHKIDNFSVNSKVSFCVVGNAFVASKRFTTIYESVIVFGKLIEVVDYEKNKALEGLLHKYSQQYFAKGLDYIAALTEKTRVFKVSIDKITGKSRK
ncbi:MAG: MFS transporter [Desulfobulbus propionicus]|nr:MAG: MFS transporter [Desulfobulbus propionicus]